MKKKSVQKGFAKKLSAGLEVDQTNNLVEWMLKNNIKTDMGQVFEFTERKYLAEYINDKGGYNGEGGNLVVMSGTQLGKTIGALTKSLGWMVYDDMSVGYSLPTQSMQDTIVKTKLDPIIENNPIFNARVKGNMSTKKVGNKFMYLVYTHSDSSGLAFSTDAFVYDEIDSSNEQAINMYHSRMGASKYAWEHFISNPTTPDCFSHRLFKKSDQKHWAVKCEHGCKWQILNFEDNLDFERGDIICKFCKRSLSPEVRINGRWVKKFQDRDTSGYWMHQLLRARPNEQFVKTMKAQYEKDLASFYRSYRGEPYAGSDVKVDANLVKSHLVDIPEGWQKQPLVLGIDIGASSKHHWVLGWNNVVYKMGQAEHFDDLEEIIREYNVKFCVIDNGPEHENIRDLQNKFEQIIFRCIYQSNRAEEKILFDDEQGVVRVARNLHLDQIINDFAQGKFKFAVHEYDPMLKVFCDQFSTLACEVGQDRWGNTEIKWESASGWDHFAHAFGYFITACERMKEFNDFNDVTSFDRTVKKYEAANQINPFEEEKDYNWLEL